MPLPVIPGVARCSIGGPILGGGRWNNNLHFRRIDLADPSGPQITDLAGVVTNFYNATVNPICPIGTSADSLDITPLDGTSGAVHSDPAVLGTQGGVPMPAEVAMVLTIRTASRGRRARGRIYLPAPASVKADAAGHLLAAIATDIITAAAAMRDAATAAGWQAGVASYGHSSKLDHTVTPVRRVTTTWDPFFTPVLTFTMDLSFDVIRGRKT